MVHSYRTPMRIATKPHCYMCSTSIAIEEVASVAYSRSLQRQSYHRLSASDLLLEEIMARGDKHGNREAKKSKKVKLKEATPVSAFASIQKHVPEATNPKKK
jgi:hypothetical protein